MNFQLWTTRQSQLRRYRRIVSKWDRDAVKALHGAVFRQDGSVVVELVHGRLSDDLLQLAGDGLLDAVAQHVKDAAGLAAECAAALRKREWDGDEELAEQLQTAIGQGATPLLRPLPVDLGSRSGLARRRGLSAGQHNQTVSVQKMPAIPACRCTNMHARAKSRPD